MKCKFPFKYVCYESFIPNINIYVKTWKFLLTNNVCAYKERACLCIRFVFLNQCINVRNFKKVLFQGQTNPCTKTQTIEGKTRNKT